MNRIKVQNEELVQTLRSEPKRVSAFNHLVADFFQFSFGFFVWIFFFSFRIAIFSSGTGRYGFMFGPLISAKKEKRVKRKICNKILFYARRMEKMRWFLNVQCVLNPSNTFLLRIESKQRTVDYHQWTSTLFYWIMLLQCNAWNVPMVITMVFGTYRPKEVDLNCTLNQWLPNSWQVAAVHFCEPFASVLTFFLLLNFIENICGSKCFFSVLL